VVALASVNVKKRDLEEGNEVGIFVELSEGTEGLLVVCAIIAVRFQKVILSKAHLRVYIGK
jgi:hypothetical protein